MIVKVEGEERLFCDICADEMDDWSGFNIKLDYGCEDACWWNPDEEHELANKYAQDTDTIFNYLAQEEYVRCDNCCMYDEGLDAVAHTLREYRVKTITTLIEKNVLPGLGDQKKLLEERLEYWREQHKEALERLKAGTLSEYGFESYAAKLVNARNKISHYTVLIEQE